MATIGKFEDLEIWKNARILCKDIFKTIVNEPRINDYKLKGQIRGSSGSIMDNIAEGFERDGNKELKQFLSYSKGSAGELKSQLYRALDNNYIDEKTFNELYKQIDNICGKLVNLMKYLSTSDYKGVKYK